MGFLLKLIGMHCVTQKCVCIDFYLPLVAYGPFSDCRCFGHTFDKERHCNLVEVA
jgi:hypothetical protein